MKTKELTQRDSSQKPWCNRCAILYNGESGKFLPVKPFWLGNRCRKASLIGSWQNGF
jgi:hypothetical protein